ncbi:MAG: hypothetical protein IT222_11585 [Crocinitomix sp.]|nr:hypothetical protein [Crocinitomix sp.]
MKSIFTACFILVVQGLFAQNESDLSVKNEPWSLSNADKILKFSPLDVLSYSPNLGADLEVSMKKNYSLQGGLSYYPDFMQFMSDANSYDYMFGYRSRIEARYYRSERRAGYFAMGISFKHLFIRDEFSFGMERTQDQNGNLNYTYFQTKDMWMHRFSTFIDFKIGIQKKFRGTNVWIDLYTGISIRNNSVKTWSTMVEGGDMMREGGMWNLQDGHDMTYPTPIFGLKIGVPAFRNSN